MPSRHNTRSTRARHHHPFKLMVRFAGRRWVEMKAFLRAVTRTPPLPRIGLGLVLFWVGLLAVNWVYHTIDKPTELFFPVENALDKSPRATWQEYGTLFKEHSTPTVAPELLAALAQAEGAGNPVARTYWRWRVSAWNPLEWYQPASTAVGMFQLTDETFQEGKHYCIHNHQVVAEGPWYDFDSCWFNSLYTRVLPSHAIELTAVLLDRQVAQAIGNRQATLEQKQNLAAVIHLCGAGAGHDFVKRKYRLTTHQRCGDHDVRIYLRKIQTLTQQFTSLKAF